MKPSKAFRLGGLACAGTVIFSIWTASGDVRIATAIILWAVFYSAAAILKELER